MSVRQDNSWSPSTVDGGATAGSDYQATSGTLTFAPGVTSLPIAVLINGDQLGEFDEAFQVGLSNTTSALIMNGTGSGTIQNDEPVVSAGESSVIEGNRRKKLKTFTVNLSTASDQPVSVHYTTEEYSAAAGKDFLPASGIRTFAPGQTSNTFTVSIKGDKKREPDEAFFITLSDVSTNAVIADNFAAGIIINDDRLRRRPDRTGRAIGRKH